jgi:tetratricopeptide (TPR) repeat protein
MEALKKKFRDGLRAEAISDCEILCLANPGNADLKQLCATMHALEQNHPRALELLYELLDTRKHDADIHFNIGTCERELRNFEAAARHFEIYSQLFPDRADGWASLAECSFQLGAFDEGVALADRAIGCDPSLLAPWLVRANCQKSSRRFDAALASYARADQIQPTVESLLNAGQVRVETGALTKAVDCFTRGIELDSGLARLRVLRGDVFQRLDDLQAAAADYAEALRLAPDDDETLRKATLCLLELDQAPSAIELCRSVLRVRPDQLTAKRGLEWVLSKLVPIWHVPMMNEDGRNQAYHDGLRAVVAPDKLVFEIGTGSGLLSMMAARLGAQEVYTCEAVDLIAQTAKKIVQANQCDDRVTVLSKPSDTVQIGPDIPRQADVLVHEIFSSELLGEHVLPAIEDAKRRLLRPGGDIMPSAASIMIALVGGDALGRNLHVGDVSGFDLRGFNAIYPKNRLLHREDLEPVMMCDDIEAFRFDFVRDSAFPAEEKVIEVAATGAGPCHGIIQWIRIELSPGVRYENHPAARRQVTGWQHMVFGFDEPIQLALGSRLRIKAMHDRSRPWFELAPDPDH